MTGPLIVIQCGKTKADQPSEAADLYRGNFFRGCLAYSKVVARVWPHARYPMDAVPGGMGGRLRWLGRQLEVAR